MKLKLLESALSTIGAVVLFASWIIQQFLFSEWNSTLSTLASVDAAVHSYKAADGVIRAVAIAGKDVQRNDGDTIEKRLDINFNRAASHVFETVDKALYEEHLKVIPVPHDSGAYAVYNTRLHNQYDALHRAIAAERERFESRKKLAEFAFLVLYVLGTVALIAASTSKYLDAKAEAGKSAA